MLLWPSLKLTAKAPRKTSLVWKFRCTFLLSQTAPGSWLFKNSHIIQSTCFPRYSNSLSRGSYTTRLRNDQKTWFDWWYEDVYIIISWANLPSVCLRTMLNCRDTVFHLLIKGYCKYCATCSLEENGVAGNRSKILAPNLCSFRMY